MVAIQLHTVQGKLTPTPPFDFAKSLAFLGYFAPMLNEQAVTTDTLTKAVLIEGQVVAFQLTSQGTLQEPQLDYTLFSQQTMSKAIEEQAIDRITFFLSLDDDLRHFYQLGLNDPEFAPIVQEQYGYHQVKFLTPFEIACWAVLTQRNPMTMAHKMKQALTQTYGGSVQGTTYWAFPEAARFAHVSIDELQAIVRNARKAEYLYAVIQAFQSVDEHFLRTGDIDEVEDWLHNIRGFGAWSVSFVLLRGLGRTERIPQGEKRLQEAVARVYGHGKQLSPAEIGKIAERYGTQQGYWAHYLRVGA